MISLAPFHSDTSWLKCSKYLYSGLPPPTVLPLSPLSYSLSEQGERDRQRCSRSQEAQAWGPACSASPIRKAYRTSCSSGLWRLQKEQAGYHDSHWAYDELCSKGQTSIKGSCHLSQDWGLGPQASCSVGWSLSEFDSFSGIAALSSLPRPTAPTHLKGAFCS